ncbi:MAG: hypothetical protein QHH17_07500 [Candidatus Bathyarchaeota archaeon]|nr:hypothetical protein [Candidatus Bathyarchaeota archaeon]
MPTISVDTFFACSLMVLLVLSAMAASTMLLSPHINSVSSENMGKRYGEIAKYLLLNFGEPQNWGQNSQTIPETFGLAKAGSNIPYELDIDKVSRLNGKNLYALSYVDIFSVLKMADVSFRIELKPIFEVAITLGATYPSVDDTVYEFEIFTKKHGVPVQAELKGCVIARNYFEAKNAFTSDGETYINVTLSNAVEGPALLIIIARSISNAKIVSFNIYAFAHNSGEPESNDTFLKFSPLNYSLNVSYLYPEITLLDAYALTFNYYSNLTQTANNSQSVEYDIPNFVDASPILMVITGLNSTSFFAEWVAYPQIPLEIGVDFTDSVSLSNVFAYRYIVTVNSVLYECWVWLGGS